MVVLVRTMPETVAHPVRQVPQMADIGCFGQKSACSPAPNASAATVVRKIEHKLVAKYAAKPSKTMKQHETTIKYHQYVSWISLDT